MAVISKALEKIKALVLIVKGSPLQWEELMKCATQCGLDTSKCIQLDVSTRWNSTYMMLRDALYYKPAFIRLNIANHCKYEKISPSSSDWGMAATVFQCVEIFYDLTELVSRTSYPTAHLFYRGFCELRELLSVDVKSAPHAKHIASRISWLHTRGPGVENPEACQSIFPETDKG
jgi:hypothetical protein